MHILGVSKTSLLCSGLKEVIPYVVVERGELGCVLRVVRMMLAGGKGAVGRPATHLHSAGFSRLSRRRQMERLAGNSFPQPTVHDSLASYRPTRVYLSRVNRK